MKHKIIFNSPPNKLYYFSINLNIILLYANFNENKLKNVWFLISLLKVLQEPLFGDYLPLPPSCVPILNRIQDNLNMGDEQLVVMTSSSTLLLSFTSFTNKDNHKNSLIVFPVLFFFTP